MENKDLYDELSSIKNIMERSTKFISLSGLSGVLAGVYALIGSGIAYIIIRNNNSSHDFFVAILNYVNIVLYLSIIAVSVLLLSLITGYILSAKKAKNKGESIWNKTSRLLLFNSAIPLATGGIIVIILIYQGIIGFVVPTMLIFYGLALFNAGNFTYRDVRYLGLIEIILGLVTAGFPKYSFWAWALGFGVLHILYGTMMYFKYDRENNVN